MLPSFCNVLPKKEGIPIVRSIVTLKGPVLRTMAAYYSPAGTKLPVEPISHALPV